MLPELVFDIDKTPLTKKEVSEFESKLNELKLSQDRKIAFFIIFFVLSTLILVYFGWDGIAILFALLGIFFTRKTDDYKKKIESRLKVLEVFDLDGKDTLGFIDMLESMPEYKPYFKKVIDTRSVYKVEVEQLRLRKKEQLKKKQKDILNKLLAE